MDIEDGAGLLAVSTMLPGPSAEEGVKRRCRSSNGYLGCGTGRSTAFLAGAGRKAAGD